MELGTIVKDIRLQQGADFRKEYQWTFDNDEPIPMVDYAARLQIRKYPGGPVLLDISTSAGGITIDGENGIVALAITAAQTYAMAFTSAVYQLKLRTSVADGSLELVVMEGRVMLTPAVTPLIGV